jgi:hypothetical protein
MSVEIKSVVLDNVYMVVEGNRIEATDVEDMHTQVFYGFEPHEVVGMVQDFRGVA